MANPDRLLRVQQRCMARQPRCVQPNMPSPSSIPQAPPWIVSASLSRRDVKHVRSRPAIRGLVRRIWRMDLVFLKAWLASVDLLEGGTLLATDNGEFESVVQHEFRENYSWFRRVE